MGYIGRAICAEQTPNYTLGPYIVQILFPLVAPALLAASIYMILGGIILLVDGESLSIIRKKWLTKIFVSGDVLCFLLQAAGINASHKSIPRKLLTVSPGGGIMAGGSVSSVATGSHIVVAGVGVQIAFFGLFMLVAFIFDSRIRHHPTPKSQSSALPWQKHMYALYAASVLIMIRSIFRVVEYVQGNNGYLMRHEWFLYIFDALLMFTVLVIYNFVHLSEIKALSQGGKWSSGVKMHSIDTACSSRGSDSAFGFD